VTLRENWEHIKLDKMRTFVEAKFAQNTLLAKQLLATRNKKLLEGNRWHDTYWGCCICEGHRGEGQNHLGKILMKVRTLLRERGLE
jgi:N-glycosidase YbiA